MATGSEPATARAAREACAPDVIAPLKVEYVNVDQPTRAGSRAQRPLHVLAPGDVGGLETVVRSLAAAQRRAGHEVHVATIIDDPASAQEYRGALTLDGATVHAVVVTGRSYHAERRSMDAILQRVQPTVVHVHGYRAGLVDAPVARRRGIPTVVTIHGFTDGGWRNRAYEWALRRACRRFSAVIAVSRPIVSRLTAASVPEARIHLVPNATALSEQPRSRTEARSALGLPREACLLGWIGRLTPEKGADVMLRALADPVLAGDARLVIVGDGADRGMLEQLAKRLGVADRVTWLGIVRDAASLVAAFDVVVLSSRLEGTPMVMLEAMSAGVPVVATRVGGIPDVAADGEALLVPPESPMQLARAVREVFDDPAVASRRADAARTTIARRFGVAQWLERHDAIYDQVTTPSRQPT